MIKTVGVVAEFNPFHNGHKALLATGKNMGYSHCVVVMSGNYVQRGQPAIATKWVRTKAALMNGTDLVVELPLAYAAATAQRFAQAAVSLLKSTGVVDALLFASESGEISPLKTVVDSFYHPDFNSLLKSFLEKGDSYATSRTKTVESLLGKKHSELLLQPNNILGIEYLKAAKEAKWNAVPLTIRRFGGGHHSMETTRSFASGTKIRSLGVNWDEIKDFVPPSALALYKKAEREGLYPYMEEKFETLLLSSLRRLSLEDIKKLPDISEGLENRIFRAIKAATSVEELYQNIQSKRYPQSRGRRIALAGALGITEKDATCPLSYLRILGATKKGLKLLGLMKERSTLPFSSRLLDLEKLDTEAKRGGFLESSSTDQYALLFPTTHPSGLEYTKPGIFI